MNKQYKIERKNAAIIGVDFIVVAIVILIISALSIAIIYPMIAGVPIASTDKLLQTATGYGTKFTPTANATVSLITNSGVALSLAPMMSIAAIAAGIITMLLFAFASAGRPGL